MALSGGIDSSVVAHMLHQAGHELIGVRFTLWSDPLAPAIAQVLPSKCCNAQTAARAAQVAKSLGIPYHIVDLEQDFKTEVVDPFLQAHRDGLTPNPCIQCNRTMKFGRLVDLMRQFGCEKIATGHYARIQTEELPDGTNQLVLLQAVDTGKDQSYYLSGLNQEQLSYALFPLGGMSKAEVYQLANKFHIPYDEYYRESQDLCFFPEKSPHEFLKRHLSESMQPGPIMRENGQVVGEHHGLPLYTPGQRHGLGIGGLKIPLEVIYKDRERNSLIVADKGSTKLNELVLDQLHWISGQPPQDTQNLSCKTRSLGELRTGHLLSTNGGVYFRFTSPIEIQSPGQYIVFYHGPEVLGSARIIESRKSETSH